MNGLGEVVLEVYVVDVVFTVGSWLVVEGCCVALSLDNVLYVVAGVELGS